MKRDTIFYELFKEFPNIFFELIGETNINPDIYNFRSQEVKQKSFRLDGIFAPPRGNRNQPTFFVEVQCYKDLKFYRRFFTSIILHFNQYPPYNPDWYAIVIFDTPKHDVSFPGYLDGLKPHLKCFYLSNMGDDAYESLGLGILKLVVEGKRKAKKSAKQLVDKARQELTNKAAQETFLELIESIIINKYPKLSREQVQEMLTLNLIRGTRYYQELEEEITAKVEKKIEKKVRAKAREEVKLDTAARLLQRGISPQEVAAILELDVEAVNNIVNPQS